MPDSDTQYIKVKRPAHAEFREWFTMILSACSAFLLWTARNYVQNQRLEIKAESDKNYVHIDDYDKNNTRLWDKVNSTNEKLDSMKLDLVHINDSVGSLERTLIGTQPTKHQ